MGEAMHVWREGYKSLFLLYNLPKTVPKIIFNFLKLSSTITIILKSPPELGRIGQAGHTPSQWPIQLLFSPVFLLQCKDFANTSLDTGATLPISAHHHPQRCADYWTWHLDLKGWRAKLYSFSFYITKYKWHSWLVFMDTGPVEDIWND